MFETAVRPVMDEFALTASIKVSGTPDRPKPPHRRVLFDFMSLIASCADGKTLLISLRRREELKLRARLRYVYECQLAPSEAARIAPTFVLLREKVRAVRSVRATDGIVLEA